MHILKGLGFGLKMLFALFTLYKVMNSILGVALITETISVKRGSPTSCFLLIVLVNPSVRMLKDTCGDDGYLLWLHVLMLMNDTFILAWRLQSALQKKTDIAWLLWVSRYGRYRKLDEIHGNQWSWCRQTVYRHVWFTDWTLWRICVFEIHFHVQWQNYITAKALYE